MTVLRCIAIEDEPHALELMEYYARQIPSLQWQGGFRQPLDALPLLNSNQVDLMFLDINLHQMSGLSFYRSLAHKPLVIITTAYSEYAVESYQIDAVDYLVKPVLFERFVLACNKALRHKSYDEVSDMPKTDRVEAIYLKSGSKWFHLKWSEISYLEKSENYVIFHASGDRKILSRQNMSDVEQIMPAFFCRIHKSFIVNINCIDVIERERITVHKNALPLADSYRENFMKKVGI